MCENAITLIKINEFKSQEVKLGNIGTVRKSRNPGVVALKKDYPTQGPQPHPTTQQRPQPQATPNTPSRATLHACALQARWRIYAQLFMMADRGDNGVSPIAYKWRRPRSGRFACPGHRYQPCPTTTISGAALALKVLKQISKLRPYGGECNA